jgi:hypothetical protein
MPGPDMLLSDFNFASFVFLRKLLGMNLINFLLYHRFNIFSALDGILLGPY